MNMLSAALLAKYLAVTTRSVQRRAVRERWPYDEKQGVGGRQRCYRFLTLPVAVQSKVIASIVAEHDKLGQLSIDGETNAVELRWDKEKPLTFAANCQDRPLEWLNQHCILCREGKVELNEYYIKLGILSLALNYGEKLGVGKIKGLDGFCRQYNDAVLGIDEMAYSMVPRVSRITLLRWQKQEQAWLANDYAKMLNHSDRVVLDKLFESVGLEILAIVPSLSAKHLRQHFQTFFPNKKLPSVKVLVQWLWQQRTQC